MNARKGPIKRTSTKKATANKKTTRKPAAKAGRKPAAKAGAKATARKPAARAPAKRTSANANARQSNARLIRDPFSKNPGNTRYADKDERRPEDNNLPNSTVLAQIKSFFITAKEVIEDFAQHLRPLDRRRLNGVGMRKMGFIEKAYDLSTDNEEFLPHWLTGYKFGLDYSRFVQLEDILALAKQVEEMLWNITIESSDILYTDALEFYSSVQDAAKRRVDAAEAPYNLLKPYFSRMGSWSKDEEAPSERQVERDFKAFLHGRRDGEVAVVNVSPKVKAGRREVIDKKFSDSEQFKATEEAEIKE